MMASGRVFCTLPARTFTRKRQGDATSATFSAIPVGVDFHGLMKQKSTNVLPCVSNQDLFNTVIALYDVCLPDIGVENLRTYVFERGAKTVLLLRDQQEVLKEYKDKLWPEVEVPVTSSAHEASDEEECSSTFSAVFSDPDSSEEEEEEDVEESERFQSSLKEFLTAVTRRRHQRRQPDPTPDAIGIECCLVAALTFRKSALKSKEKIIELSLLSTRRRYRHCGAARYMIKLLKDVSLVGFYDAIVTHADSNAIELFTSCGFSDDVILNSKFRNLEHDWMCTTTMSYVPPFSTGPNSHLDIGDLEAEMTKWRKKSLAAYGAQSIFLNRTLNEIKILRKQVTSQKKENHKLTADLEEERRERKLLQKKLFEYQVKEIQPILDAVHLSPGDYEEDEDRKMQDLVHRSFEIEGCQLELQEIVQAALSWQITEDSKAHVPKLPVCRRLYYCGARSRPERLVEILGSGFSPQDIQQGEHGTGLYFSASPAGAINLSPPHSVLLADVYLEKTQSDGGKTTCSTPSASGCESVLAIPVCLLKYAKRGFPEQERA